MVMSSLLCPALGNIAEKTVGFIENLKNGLLGHAECMKEELRGGLLRIPTWKGLVRVFARAGDGSGMT